MWKNHLTIALRNLRRQRGYAALNIVGLSVGLACCALLALFVRGELSYDRFHENTGRIFRIESDWGDFSVPSTNWRFVEAFRTDFPQVQVATLLRDDGAVRAGERLFREDNLLYASPSFFSVFSFELARGNARTALTEPNTLVLTRAAATKYFGDEDPVGKTLRLYGQTDFTVTGVLANPPGPTHIPLNFVLSWSTLGAEWEQAQTFGRNSVYTYLLLPRGMTGASVQAALPQVLERHAGENWNGADLSLRAIEDVHLYSHREMELSPNGNPAYVVLFSAVAVFILLLACVNFVNLATARSLERAKEVGVRKSVGADRSQLARQFLAESTVLAVFGLLGAVVLMAIALPPLTTFVGRPLLTDGRMTAFALAVGLALTLLVGVGGGLYPALALSRFRPTEVLRGRFATSGRGVRLRQALVVFQFAVSVVLLVGTLVVYTQLRHLRDAQLGFDQAQIVALNGPGAPREQRLAFFEALRAQPSIEGVSSTSEHIPAELLSGWGISVPGADIPEDEQEAATSSRAAFVSPGFFEVMGVKFVAGRDFEPGSVVDSGGVILNAAGARLLMAQMPARYTSPETLVGERIGGRDTSFTVIGVVEDFNFASLHAEVQPTGFYLSEGNATYLVRTRPGAADAALAAVRQAWTATFPEAPLEYRFASEAFDAAYRNEEQLGQLFMLFSGLAVLVACLGLLGLASYAAEQRRKEIGVRKVLGASVASLVALLSRDFARLVLIAIVVATPAAYYGASRWLEGFTYRAPLGPGVFAIAGVLALAVALTTVSFQAFRAAAAAPIKALRSE